MKALALKILSFAAISAVFLFTACNKKEPVDAVWQGQWQRTVHVPKNVQGRCFDEYLSIKGKQWQLKAVLHATYECDSPYLELSYQGVLQQVLIKRASKTDAMTLVVEDISLVGVTDLSTTTSRVLSARSVKTMEQEYLPKGERNMQQKVSFNADKNKMQSSYLQPLLLLAIPSAKSSVKSTSYSRQAF